MRCVSFGFLFFLAAVISVFSQNENIDSLQKSLVHTPTDTIKINILNRLAFALRESNQEEAFKYADEAKKMAEAIHFSKGITYSLDNLAWIYNRRGLIGRAYEYATRALEVCERNGDEAQGARCLNTIASVYYEQKKFKLVLNSFERALEISTRLHDERNIIRTMGNIAYTYFFLDSIPKATYYNNISLKRAEKYGEKYLIAFQLRTKGDLLTKENKIGQALKEYDEALKVAGEAKSNFMLCTTYFRIGNTYLKEGKINKAIEYFNKNIALAKKSGYSEELERTYKIQSEAYNKLKNYSTAYYFLSLHESVHDSIFSFQNAQLLAVLQNDFDNQNRQNQVKLLTQQSQIKEKMIAQQQIIIYSIIAGLLLLSIVVFLLTYSNRQKQAINDLLTRQKDEISSRADQLVEIDNVKNKLFSILAHDLRSSFHSIHGLLNLLDSDDLNKDEVFTIGHHLRQSVSFTNTMLDNILHWARSQMQGGFTKKDKIFLKEFTDGKISYLRNNASIKSIQIINELPESLQVIADPDQLDLILRNLISNAIKFTPNLGKITISAFEKNGMAEISVNDTGIGINSEYLQKIFKEDTYFSTKGTDGEKGTGLGLVLVKEFVEKNGGKIWVESNSNVGSKFTFTLQTISAPPQAP